MRWEQLFSWCGLMGNHQRFKITVHVRAGAHREGGEKCTDLLHAGLLGAQKVQTIYTFLYCVCDFTMYGKIIANIVA